MLQERQGPGACVGFAALGMGCAWQQMGSAGELAPFPQHIDLVAGVNWSITPYCCAAG